MVEDGEDFKRRIVNGELEKIGQFFQDAPTAPFKVGF